MTLIAQSVLRRASQQPDDFRNAQPYRHIVIDDFFEADYAKRLLAEFPPFERGNARNEAGELGGKSTVERIRELGPSFAALDDLIQTPEFLGLVSRITGIPDLLYDPWYFGGGTHENREGQDLDPHIDFNRHPMEPWHRRLNLIVYLNPEWDDAWGGSLEVHSDPRRTDNQVKLVTPLFNRCVIFETNEISWHGFSRISLPESRRELSRRSIALYFYTRDRPIEELADSHSTVYVDRPLPERFVPGMLLQESDLVEIRTLLARRDQHNQRLYRDLQRIQAELERAQKALHAGRLGRLRHFLSSVMRRLRNPG